MSIRFKFLIVVLLCVNFQLQAQVLKLKNNFTLQDTLRGSITPQRAWWDLTYYDLEVNVNPDKKYISGKNTIQYKVIDPYQELQIDLQAPLNITKVIQNGVEQEVVNNGNAHFVKLSNQQTKGSLQQLEVYYQGHPKEAENAPWDGGFVWTKDAQNNAFDATACQGLGASVWWPCKDHMYDEVDSMDIRVTVPKGLMDVSNGRLVNVIENDSTSTFHWTVKNPINNYGVNVNIGKYVKFGEVYNGEKGTLDLSYYVLSYNLEKAKIQFKQVPLMLKAFEYWFGPYPFYEDGFKLVETPYLGMEHQSSVTYGNHYQNGYLGKDLSDTGLGLKFDFIIIHESGHEWFANNITYKDIADMWIHESFTAYSETLYLDYYYGKKEASKYVIGTRKKIANDRPIIGAYNVNSEGSGDMYYKGANMLHTLRQLIENDEKFRSILRGLNSTFYHQTVTTQQVENYISKASGYDLTAFFNQYLRNIKIPTLEYKIEKNKLTYRWVNIVDDFDMPIRVTLNEKTQWLYPTATWKTIKNSKKINAFKVDENFYVDLTPL